MENKIKEFVFADCYFLDFETKPDLSCMKCTFEAYYADPPSEIVNSEKKMLIVELNIEAINELDFRADGEFIADLKREYGYKANEVYHLKINFDGKELYDIEIESDFLNLKCKAKKCSTSEVIKV